jgi:hypothetical protein
MRRLSRPFVALGLAPIAMLVVSYGLSCGDPSHIFEGRPFVAERNCLGPTTSVDVVEGERPGDCGPKCLEQSMSDGGRAIYVSTMCGPYPFRFDISGTTPECAAALAALERRDTCLSDGGSSYPVPPASPTDAGGD